MAKKSILLFAFFSCLSLSSMWLTGCFFGDPFATVGPQGAAWDSLWYDGYAPVYGVPENQEIELKDGRPIADPGKIYRYGKYLLVNERKKGIHVFDNSSPGEPVNLGFVQLLGNTEMAIKDGVLYADHMGHLVALTVNDFSTIEEKGRLPLHNWHFGLPPPANAYFECVDVEKGFVVAWESDSLLNPRCYAMP